MVRFIKKLLRRTEKPAPAKKAAPKKVAPQREIQPETPPERVEKRPAQEKILTAEGFLRLKLRKLGK
jgi:hypothetical protein